MLKRSSSLYCGSQDRPKDWNNVKEQSKCKNILFVNFNYQGLLHYKYVPVCQLMNQEFYLTFFDMYGEQCKRNDQNFARNAAGSSPWQCTCVAYLRLSVQIFLKKKNCSGFTVTLQPFSLCSRIFPIPKIDNLTGHQFELVEEVP